MLDFVEAVKYVGLQAEDNIYLLDKLWVAIVFLKVTIVFVVIAKGIHVITFMR